MRSIVLDTGPVISLTLNNLNWILKPLQEMYEGKFLITPAVYGELIKRPLETKKYKFEALQILPMITDGTIELYNTAGLKNKTSELLDLANSCFSVHGNPLKIVHAGEMEALACAVLKKSDAIIIDERTTRTLIESPELLKNILSKKLHTDVVENKDNLEKFKKMIGNIPVLRSFELVTIAFEKGLLSRYMPEREKKMFKNLKRSVLEGVLWGVKLNGCSVKRDDIDDVIKLEKV